MTMDFKEAVSALKEGKKLRRKAWLPLDEYIELIKNNETKESNIFLFYPEHKTFSYSSDIILSNDWQVVGEDEFQLLEFAEAMNRFIKENVKIRHKGWKPKTWLEKSKDENNIYIRSMQSEIYHFDFPKMKICDWELMGE
jgi:hypothetical protein